MLKSPPHWQMSAWFSLPQQWLMTTWNKQTSTILAQTPSQYYDTVIVRRTKYQEFWKGLYVNCCDFFYAEDFAGRIGIMFNFTPLRSPDFFYTMPQEARKGKSWGGTSIRASKRILWVFTACKQMKNRRTKCSCSTTHGRAKFVPYWIPQFHQI